MAETPSQTPTPPRSASEAETETMEYWLVNPVERRSKGGKDRHPKGAQKISKSLQSSNLHNPGSGDAIGLNKTSGPKQTRTSADCRPQWSESTTLILFIFCNPRPAPSHPTKTPPPCKRSLRQEQEALATATRSLSVDEQDLLAASYGDVPLIELQSKTAEDVSHWTKVGSLTSALENRSVPIRSRAHTIRAVGKNMALVVVREMGFTVQCVATVHPDTVSRQMVKYVAGLSRDAAGGGSNEEVILCE
ncbi:hypothetical protein ACFX13_016634 [Malus domestica]